MVFVVVYKAFGDIYYEAFHSPREAQDFIFLELCCEYEKYLCLTESEYEKFRDSFNSAYVYASLIDVLHLIHGKLIEEYENEPGTDADFDTYAVEIANGNGYYNDDGWYVSYSGSGIDIFGDPVS